MAIVRSGAGSAGRGAAQRHRVDMIDGQIPHRLTSETKALLGAGPERAGLVPLPGGQDVTA